MNTHTYLTVVVGNGKYKMIFVGDNGPENFFIRNYCGF